MKSLLDRVKDRCKVEEDTGCWVWQQTANAEGHPQMWVVSLNDKRQMLVRRLVYELAVGKLTNRKIVVSTCQDPRCCNPEHLKASTRSVEGSKVLKEVNEKMTPEYRRLIRNKSLGKIQKSAWHP